MNVLTIGWTCLFIIVAGLSSVTLVGGTLLYGETYAPATRRRVMQETKEAGKASEGQSHQSPRNLKQSESYFNRQRPFMLLARSIVCFTFSSYGPVSPF
jgi:hypothetical protein